MQKAALGRCSPSVGEWVTLLVVRQRSAALAGVSALFRRNKDKPSDKPAAASSKSKMPPAVAAAVAAADADVQKDKARAPSHKTAARCGPSAWTVRAGGRLGRTR